MSTIVEVHDKKEAEYALNFEKAIVGINNRNLKTLETNISTTYNLYEILSGHPQPIISESGLKSKKEIEEIIEKTKINNFLVGESVLKSPNIALKLREFTQISLEK